MAQLPNTKFDAQWYLTAYPDVSLSGLSPEEHYKRFGRLLGRMPNDDGPDAAVILERVTGSVSFPAVQPHTILPIHHYDTSFTVNQAADAIVERPTGLNLAAVVPQPAPIPKGMTAGQAVPIEFLSDALNDDLASENRRRIEAYKRMLSPASTDDGFDSPSVLNRFVSDKVRIDCAWIVNDSDGKRLRLMIKGDSQSDTDLGGCVVRAWQADPSQPHMVQQSGQGIRLPASGPAFHDIELIHPLMPVILQFSDAADVTRDFGLIPFPSLLPGGLHAAELKALQNLSDPMDSFWSLSDALFAELLGTSSDPTRSINRLSFIRTDGPQPKISVDASTLGWLDAIFGFRPLPGVDGNELTLHSETAGSDGRCLRLPADSVPTLAALVSRRLPKAGAQQAGPFLVSEYPDLRPRWAVTLPATEGPHSQTTVLMPTAEQPADGTWTIPVYLSIALRDPVSAAVTVDTESDLADLPPLTVLMEARDATRTQALLKVLSTLIARNQLDILVRVTGNKNELRPVIDGICGKNEWKEVPVGENLRRLVGAVPHEFILTISDQVALDHGAALKGLFAMLNADARAASASCLLLGEKVIKNTRVVQPASGGLFPAHVSFVHSPQMGFAEPDVAQPLAGLTYPVVANNRAFTLWRVQALVGLQARPALGPAAHDISLGLDLLANGWRNLCTTQFSTGVHDIGQRCDAIDPIGSAYVQPGNWEDIFNQVTVVRELFS